MLRIFKLKAKKMFVQISEGDGRSAWFTKNAYIEKMIEKQRTKCRDYQSGSTTLRFSESLTTHLMTR